MNILVTGGAGYIGTHTLIALLGAGHSVVALDNLSNGKAESWNRVEEIAGKPLDRAILDLRDGEALDSLFGSHQLDAVIHFAGFKAVGESVAKPLDYYDNNLGSTISLLKVMARHDCKQLVFSSSATVYGDPEHLPIREDAPLSVTNPYGRTKLMIEDILRDVAAADPTWRIALLRYFNPVGAHPSGRIGEDPNGKPNNLLPYICQVAVGRLEELSVFGDDYPTPDGTGVRDYIHVCDLADGHLCAVERLKSLHGAVPINLGTGQGYSVFEILNAFRRVSGTNPAFRVVARRSGDIASCYADPRRARELLGWSAGRDLEDMCRDAWMWQSQNPRGFSAV